MPMVRVSNGGTADVESMNFNGNYTGQASATISVDSDSTYLIMRYQGDSTVRTMTVNSGGSIVKEVATGIGSPTARSFIVKTTSTSLSLTWSPGGNSLYGVFYWKLA